MRPIATGFILLSLLIAVNAPRRSAAAAADSSLGLRASFAPPWNPPVALSPLRPWEQAVRLPGRVVSLPVVVLGRATGRAVLFLEQADAVGRGLELTRGSHRLGIEFGPASLGQHSGLGGELRWAPPRLDHRLLFELNGTVRHYSRERATAFVGPVGALYSSEWLPSELFYGTGLGTTAAGVSSYSAHVQSSRLMLAWGWQRLDSTTLRASGPLMFDDGVRVRGPRHRTWVTAWAGPREQTISRGRDSEHPSFQFVHPEQGAAWLDRTVEHFVYGAGLSHDARNGRPHWSRGWRASVEAERHDRSIRALAMNDADTGARSFTRVTCRGETGLSFGRDSRTLRLSFKTVDTRLDAAPGVFLLGDLQSLGGSAGLAGFESGRFRDLDLMVGRASYLFPLVKNLELDLHAETGGVYAAMSQAALRTLKGSFGTALRLRTSSSMFAALGSDWSSEKVRFWFSLGGVE